MIDGGCTVALCDTSAQVCSLALKSLVAVVAIVRSSLIVVFATVLPVVASVEIKGLAAMSEGLAAVSGFATVLVMVRVAVILMLFARCCSLMVQHHCAVWR